MKKATRYTQEQWEYFIIDWQNSSTLEEFCSRHDISKDDACWRASKLRKKGIPLRKMYKKSHIEWNDLKLMFASIRPVSDMTLIDKLITVIEDYTGELE